MHFISLDCESTAELLVSSQIDLSNPSMHQDKIDLLNQRLLKLLNSSCLFLVCVYVLFLIWSFRTETETHTLTSNTQRFAHVERKQTGISFSFLRASVIYHRMFLKATSDSVILIRYNTLLIVELETPPPKKAEVWPVKCLGTVLFARWSSSLSSLLMQGWVEEGPQLRNLFGIILTIQSLCGRAERLK